MAGSTPGLGTIEQGQNMTNTANIGPVISEAPPKVNEWRRFTKVFLGRGVVIFALVVLILLVVAAIFAPWLAPSDPYEIHLDKALLQPSSQYLLGTDYLGRDNLTRVIFGARTSLIVGFAALLIASSIGTALGLLAGYYHGITNTLIMRFIDTLMTFPMIILALLLATLLGGGMVNVIIALGIAMMPGYARMMCGQALSNKENDYILAARSLGGSNVRVMFRHVLPNCLPPLMIMGTMQIGATILAEAGLSFLGIGIESPTAAWGSMVNQGRNYLMQNPIISVAPGIAIMLTVFSFNMLGDGLRDALDPRLRGIL